MTWGQSPKADRKNTETNSGWPKETKDKSGGRFKERYDFFFEFFSTFFKNLRLFTVLFISWSKLKLNVAVIYWILLALVLMFSILLWWAFYIDFLVLENFRLYFEPSIWSTKLNFYRDKVLCNPPVVAATKGNIPSCISNLYFIKNVQ